MTTWTAGKRCVNFSFGVGGPASGIFAGRFTDESYHSDKDTLSYGIGFVGVPPLTRFKDSARRINFFPIWSYLVAVVADADGSSDAR